MKNEKLKNDIVKDILIYIILFFPISSILKQYIGKLNLVLTGVTFLLFLINYLKNNIKFSRLVLCIYIFFTFVYNIYIWGLNYYEDNMLFYFPFLILYFCFFIDNCTYIYNFIIEHKKYLNFIIYLWCIIVGISFAIPSCYKYEGETLGFVSFVNTTFLLCPIAIYILALIILQSCIYKNKIYNILLIIPSACILLGTTRTYLVVLACALCIFFYIKLNDNKKFLPLLIILAIIFCGIILLSPIKNKFIDTFNRTKNGIDPLVAFTSGRSEFWYYDITHILNNNVLKKIIGNGVNYIFYLNKPEFHVPLWAHNDFIQILGDYGFLGLLIYLLMIKYLVKNIIRKEKKVSKIIIVICIVMWAFNAFFNMFYTYFCACLSFPFYLLILKIDADKREKGEDYNEENFTAYMVSKQ